MAMTDAMYARLKPSLYHVVSPAGMERMAFVRQQYIKLEKLVLECCPESRSLSLAMTHLEDSLMRAIQSIALVEGIAEELP